MSLRWFADWLDTHAWSTALHESLYMYPYIETTHVLALTLFVGTLAIVDLRMLGFAYRTTPISTISQSVLPWTVVGFVIMFVTGLLLFYAIPVRTYHSVWFRIKVIMIVLAAINATHYHYRISKNRILWDNAPRPPRSVRMTAAASLFLWVVVIFSGRMIAYNWFDCDRPQPDWVITLAGCVIDEVASL
ncbi:MAG: hypothetical protein OXG05_12480 [Gammaproteobacteria bacterium]|nr:hypothetical protein [Gammaproteobacteria bacterium]